MDLIIETFRADGSNKINEIRELLYQTYIIEQRWIPSLDNPSGLRIDGNLLIDNYDQKKGTVWTTIYYKDKLIACGRSVERDEKGEFEVQKYPSARHLKEILDKYPRLVELTRAAVHSNFRNSKIFLSLLSNGLKYHCKNRVSVFTLTADDKLIFLYKMLGFTHFKEAKFKYEERDDKEVELFIATVEDDQLDNIIKKIEDLIYAKAKL